MDQTAPEIDKKRFRRKIERIKVENSMERVKRQGEIEMLSGEEWWKRGKQGE